MEENEVPQNKIKLFKKRNFNNRWVIVYHGELGLMVQNFSSVSGILIKIVGMVRVGYKLFDQDSVDTFLEVAKLFTQEAYSEPPFKS